MFKQFSFAIIVALFISLNNYSPVFAEGKYNIKQMTPEVEAALGNRRDRYEKLRGLKEKGAVGENNRGYTEVLGNDPEAQSVVDAENKDRHFIYTTIVEQNDLPQDALSTVEKVFTQEQRDRANPGDKIQQEDGSRVTK